MAWYQVSVTENIKKRQRLRKAHKNQRAVMAFAREMANAAPNR